MFSSLTIIITYEILHKAVKYLRKSLFTISVKLEKHRTAWTVLTAVKLLKSQYLLWWWQLYLLKYVWRLSNDVNLIRILIGYLCWNYNSVTFDNFNEFPGFFLYWGDKATSKVPREFSGLNSCFLKVSRRDGIRGLYRGVLISCCGIAIYRGFYFGLFDLTKVKYRQYTVEGTPTAKPPTIVLFVLAQVQTQRWRFNSRYIDFFF